MASTAQLAPTWTVPADGAPTRMHNAQICRINWQSLDDSDGRLAWNALTACAAEPNPFYESWYLLASLRAHDPQQRVKLLRFEFDGQLAGLLPLTTEQRYYRWPFPYQRNWVHANCFLGQPLVARGLEHQFWRALLGWADNNAGAALFLHLTELPLAGPLYEALSAVLAEQNRPAALVHREERALLHSSAEPEAYLEASLSGKKRKELRRQFARLSELGEVHFTRDQDALGLERWIDQFLELEHSGWKGSAGSALSSHLATETMFREALTGAAAQGRLERITLWLDYEPIAMLVNFLTPPGAFSYKTAFDERYARFSPGVLLQRENLDLLRHESIRWCDSCAAADHPMIDHLWRERRAIGRFSIGIGGSLRRTIFRALARAELGRNPSGLTR